jgi:hypothetical protein
MKTKLHAVSDADGRPFNFFTTAGQVSDYTGATALLDNLLKKWAAWRPVVMTPIASGTPESQRHPALQSGVADRATSRSATPRAAAGAAAASRSRSAV